MNELDAVRYIIRTKIRSLMYEMTFNSSVYRTDGSIAVPSPEAGILRLELMEMGISGIYEVKEDGRLVVLSLTTMRFE